MLSFRGRSICGFAFEERYLDIVVPFRAWRYSPQAGELTHLVAPPYDVIGPDLQSRLYASSPYNVVRVDLGTTAPDDDDRENQYTRASELIAHWKRSGVLVRDPAPSITFVEERFTGPDGRTGHRHGVLAAMRLSEFDEGIVFPHEHTLTGPKEDRFRLMSASAMSLSPVFLLYDLPGDDITASWERALSRGVPASTTVDEAGNTTRVWPTSDPDLLDLVSQKLAGSRFLVADGHHRYETALRYQKAQLSESGAPRDSRPAYSHCLVYLANLSDPGLNIYPTHRLVSGLPANAVLELPDALSGAFEVERLTGGAYSVGHETAGPRAAVAQASISLYLQRHPRRAFGLWGPLFEAPLGLQLVDKGAERAASGHTAAYHELDVNILQTLILEKALGISAADMSTEKHVAFFKDSADAFSRLEAGEFQVGFFMNPTGLDQVCEVAFGGERLPQKTTFFYTKLPTGLVFHDLMGAL
jgi:uncharacterized protein (DUF1015 family)